MLYYEYFDYIHALPSKDIIDSMELFNYNPDSIGFSYMLWHYSDIKAVAKQLAKDNFIIVLAMGYTKVSDGDFELSKDPYLWAFAFKDDAIDPRIKRGDCRVDVQFKEEVLLGACNQFIRELEEDQAYVKNLYFSLEIYSLEEYTASLLENRYRPKPT